MSVSFIHNVDPKGRKGKTFIQKNLKDKYPERIFQFIDGKATDVYHQLHKHKNKIWAGTECHFSTT